MKRLALIAVAAATAFAPLAATPAFADPPRHERGWGHDRGHNDRHHRRDHRRDDRRHHRSEHWDFHRHNGYNYNGHWYYGPPPAAYYGRPGYHPGYHAWRRGDRMPAYYRDRVVVVHDYHRHRGLYAPPRGYHWVRDDRGDYLLIGIATGVILSAILNSY